MVAAAPPLESWLTGVPAGVGHPCSPAGFAVEPTAVVEDAELLGRPLIRHWIAAGHRLLVRRTVDGAPVDAAANLGSFTGTFGTPDSDLVLDSGYRLHVRPYGSAEFLTYDAPAVLRVTDSDDFSAYLRDADTAWVSGTFAEHVTHPTVVVAELSALGAAAEHAAPQFRVYVSEDGAVSTSPTGEPLGTADDRLADLERRWHGRNAASAFPDAVGLARVVGEDDRVAALRERPWMSRYLAAVGAVRSVRADHRVPSRVSGFGGRITDGLPESTVPDPLGAPLLLQVGRSQFAHDPLTGARLSVSGVALAIIESLLAHVDRSEAAHWCSSSLGITPATAGAHLQDTLRLLDAAGISARWADDVGDHAPVGGVRIGSA